MKKTINDLKPRDIVYSLVGTTIYPHQVDSIGIKEIVLNDNFSAKIDSNDLTSWMFIASSRYGSDRTIYLNKIDVLKLKHSKLEDELKDVFKKQQNFLDLVFQKNKSIFELNVEIINELKKQ